MMVLRGAAVTMLADPTNAEEIAERKEARRKRHHSRNCAYQVATDPSIVKTKTFREHCKLILQELGEFPENIRFIELARVIERVLTKPGPKRGRVGLTSLQTIQMVDSVEFFLSEKYLTKENSKTLKATVWEKAACHLREGYNLKLQPDTIKDAYYKHRSRVHSLLTVDEVGS